MNRSVGLLLIAGASTQFGAAFAVTLFDRLGPTGTVFLRLTLAALVLCLVWRPRIRGRSATDLKLVAALGLAMVGMNVGFYNAIDRIPLGPTVTIEFLGPLAVALWGSRRARDLVWVALAALGILLLANPFGAGGLDPVGLAYAAVAAVSWGAYIPITARVGRGWHGTSGLAVGFVVGAVLVAPAGIAQGGAEVLAPELLLAGLGVALASSVIPYSFEMVALRTVPQHVFGVLMSLEPVMGALAGLIVLGQGLALTDLVAIGCVVVASTGATVSATRPPVAPGGP